MHFTPCPFWLMIVSTATVVFPVLRSPMTSSRWPRPIGVIESIALMPVWSGSDTGWRATMPGAWISSRRIVAPPRAPLPSSGWPSGSTTRPMSASPTGTDRMRPVARTSCSSSSEVSAPRMTAPIVSSSRLSARPRVPSSNSRSSFTAAVGSPEIRAMPSPTSVILPTCSAATSGVYSATCCWSTAAISSASIVSSAIGHCSSGCSFRSDQVFTQLFKAVTGAGVDEEIAHLYDRPAQQVGLVDHQELHRAVGEALQRLGHAALLVGADGQGRVNPGHAPPARLGHLLHQPVQCGDDVAHVTLEGDVDEADRHGTNLAGEETVHDALTVVDAPSRVRQGTTEPGVGLDDPGESEHLLLDLLELRRAGDLLEHGVRVPGGIRPPGTAPCDGLFGPYLFHAEPKKVADVLVQVVQHRRQLVGALGGDRPEHDPQRDRMDPRAEQVLQHRPARHRRNAEVGQHDGELVGPRDEVGHGGEVVCDRARGRLSTEGRRECLDVPAHVGAHNGLLATDVGRAQLAGRPAEVAAELRRTSTASSIRARWCSGSISRPITCLATANTRLASWVVTSSTARWRDAAISASAPATRRSCSR